METFRKQIINSLLCPLDIADRLSQCPKSPGHFVYVQTLSFLMMFFSLPTLSSLHVICHFKTDLLKGLHHYPRSSCAGLTECAAVNQEGHDVPLWDHCHRCQSLLTVSDGSGLYFKIQQIPVEDVNDMLCSEGGLPSRPMPYESLFLFMLYLGL